MSGLIVKAFSITSVGDKMSTRPKLVFTIFGSTGDLSYRKLLPALYHLEHRNLLADDFIIRCIGRREYDHATYMGMVLPWIQQQSRFNFDEATFNRFSQRIHYVQMKFTELDAYTLLNQHVQGHDNLYYLAVAPEYFETIAEGIHKNKHVETRHRLILEKPFGEDFKHAQVVNRELIQRFGEDQLYYIDHYLGKEMIQNITAIRFSNRLFSNVWNKHHIEQIQITVAETVGVESRASYYEQAGAIKDMLQNHLLQILSYVAMDEPKTLTRHDVSHQQIKVLQHLDIMKGVLGQYGSTTNAKAYLEEESVAPKSQTETYVALKVQLNQGSLESVPIYLRTGKRLDHRATYIKVVFKQAESMLFKHVDPEVLTIKVQPDEGVSVQFNAKKPGTVDTMTTVKMDFCQSCIIENRINTPEAYERLLDDAFHQDNTLFTPWPMVELSWQIGDKLEQLKRDAKLPLSIYPASSSGPIEADTLLSQDGFYWLSEDELSYEKLM
jgi:glucose-6-phosphate 1-dehydrogenase